MTASLQILDRLAVDFSIRTPPAIGIKGLGTRLPMRVPCPAAATIREKLTSPTVADVILPPIEQHLNQGDHVRQLLNVVLRETCT